MYRTILTIMYVWCSTLYITAGPQKEQRIFKPVATQKIPHQKTTSHSSELDVAHTLLHLRNKTGQAQHRKQSPSTLVTPRTISRDTVNRLIRRIQHDSLSRAEEQNAIIRDICSIGNIQHVFTPAEQTQIVHCLISRKTFTLLYNLYQKGLSLSGNNAEHHSALDRIIQRATFKKKGRAPYLLVKACVDEHIPITRYALNSKFQKTNTQFLNNLDMLFKLDSELANRIQLPTNIKRMYNRHITKNTTQHTSS